MVTKALKVLLILTVIALIALNIFTAGQSALRARAPVPGIPSVMVASYQHNLTILIQDELGPYVYSTINVTGSYKLLNGTENSLVESLHHTYYLGIVISNVSSMSFNATAVDRTGGMIYYFNGTVTLNSSDPTSDTVSTFRGGETNYIVLGIDPFEAAMEGVRHA